eukprot:CAMPEP_0185854256 /NCGR_PEP_ID=MMETSP1354-20130828/21805_1 /TAXON_ID=708628 /ORGANISM="Erythrolobus madagascarensis, Strain CCMP3276" /LENGTH=40 /DNA_ID= /DNA_START= /DNA_END= /DNA_ORIENTATION=
MTLSARAHASTTAHAFGRERMARKSSDTASDSSTAEHPCA